MSPRALRLDGLVCDLDGVVYRGSDPIPGAAAAIAKFRSEGLRVLFATNNATHTSASYLERLERFGIAAERPDLLTSAMVTAEEIARRGWSGMSAFLVGSDGIKEELQNLGMRFLDGDEARRAEIVVTSGDPRFSYDSMRTAAFALRNGARFIATNDDPTFPAPDGLWPGAGAILAAIERASGRHAEVMGKPHMPMMEAAGRRLEGCESIGVVGDQPATDLAGGRTLGWTTILVLTGVTGSEQVPSLEFAPDFVAADLTEVASLLEPVVDGKA
ncbi:MAG: HAD-IIA family hydrolase [Actinomycetota bacterium]